MSSSLRVRKLFCLLALFMSSLLVPMPKASATDNTITVNGNCSLHDAIKAANEDRAVNGCPAGDGADLILLKKDITLITRLPDITSDILIEGNGFAISGDNTYRIFYVGAGGFVINELTLSKGRDHDGGAIRVRPGGSLIVNKSTFIGNSALNAGGAILSGGKLIIKDSMFTNNTANQRGGAIYVWGKDAAVSIINSLFSGNSVDNWGGGISLNRATGTIVNSIFRANRAYEGGAIYGSGSSLVIENTTIGDNWATHGGGAIGDIASQLTILASALLDNKAEVDGGAISSERGVISIVNTTFAGNSAVRHGGAIHVSGRISLSHVTVANNSATVGGGIYNEGGTVNLFSSLIAGSRGGDCFGGLYSNSNNLIQDGSCDPALSGDPMIHALWGSPAYYLLADASPAIDAIESRDCEPTDQAGTARPQGRKCDIGAVEHVPLARLPIPTLAAEPNRPPIQDPQAGIVVDEDCSLEDAITVANTDWAHSGCPAGSGADTITLTEDIKLMQALPSVTSNITIEGKGKTISGNNRNRIFSVAGGKLTLNHVRLTEGRSKSGAAIHCFNGKIIINSSTIEDNVAWSAILSYGGGILCWPCDLSINHSIIRGNTAAGDGGGIYFASASADKSLRIRNSVIERNQAENGGGLFFGAGADSSDSSITGSTFYDNWATAHGGAIYHAGAEASGELFVLNSTFSENRASQGGALYTDAHARNTLSHVTFAFNDAGWGSSIYAFGNTNLYNSIAKGQVRNEECYGQLNDNIGNIITDGSCEPAMKSNSMLGDLVEPEDGSSAYFPLRPGSPAIDAAIDEYCTEADQIGTPRPQGDVCDIGAIEYVPPTGKEN